VIPDSELDPERLRGELSALLGDPGRLAQMGEAALRLARPDAAERIAEVALELAEVAV
jgi:UDP-N-acetylglucosamine--N-acetylmuramyl-(pentapeptide) pyrophosphoryl-undecaprenol N-acetylglucosamine transferase